LSWQSTVANRLKIKKTQKRIILDKTGVLLHENFLEYLKTEEINFVVLNSLSEILLQAGLPTQAIILSQYQELPGSLFNKIDITVYDYTQLPIEIEYSLFETLNADCLVDLLLFYTDSGKTNFITEANLQKILAASKNHKNKIASDTLKDQIDVILQNNTIDHYDKLIELGQLWGEYTYLCYKVDIIPDESLLTAIDEKTENAVLNGCLTHSFHTSVNDLKTVNKIRSYVKLKNTSKIALICFDGMGVAEWKLLEKYLLVYGFKFSEKHLFALIPTMTSISRSSIYYGSCESVYSLSSINEEKQLSDFFKDKFCKF